MYGMGACVVEWFKSYLKNRLQSAKVNGAVSSTSVTRCGVRQGSILGLLLFLLYINNIGNYLTESIVILYGDDTAVITNVLLIIYL